MSGSQKDVISKYLNRYAEPESKFGTRLERSTDHVLVIPAYDESMSLLTGTRAAFRQARVRGHRVLFIVVVNATEDDVAAVHQKNENLIGSLRTRFRTTPLHARKETPCWYAQTENCDVLILDRNTQGNQLPSGEGVGLARKIGCDLALSAIHSGSSRASLIHMSDCDVELPKNYFDVNIDTLSAALIYPFLHEPCGVVSIDEAHARYEAYLRYYVLGLRHAGSPYAYHSIGSCVAVVPRHYAAVRGVPKLQAGEDFYLLNKLAKVGRIHNTTISPITIKARRSLRVPFGTGRATNKIAQNIDRYCIYSPRIFDLIKTWLDGLTSLENTSPSTAFESVCHRAGKTLGSIDSHRLYTGLAMIGAPQALRSAIAQSPAPAVRQKWMHDWFDAFRTLKLIHALRDTGIVDVPWQDAISEATFCRPLQGVSSSTGLRGLDSFQISKSLAQLERGG
jgi:hypothetical protein